MKLYGYSKCSTVNKAIKFLEENNIDFEYIDMVLNPPTKDELSNIY